MFAWLHLMLASIMMCYQLWAMIMFTMIWSTGAQLERIWGPGDGRPVKEMKVAVDLLIQEYVMSGDLDEAAR